MRAPRAGLVRHVLGTLGVLGTIGAMALGLPLLDRSLPAVHDVADQTPYQVGSGVTVRPPPGARIDVTKTRPDANRGTVLFVVDGARLAIVAAPYRGDLAQGAQRLRRKITAATGYQVAADQYPVTTDHGVPGLRGFFTSAGRNGQYAVFLSRGVLVELTAAGPGVSQRRTSHELEQTMRSVTFGGGP